MKTTVVIPLFNEPKYILPVVTGVVKNRLPIIIVDDGSTHLNQNRSLLSKVTLLTHNINLGKGAAMKTGAEYAFSHGSDAVIFMDGDGQHSPNNLIGFLEKLRLNRFDIILGARNVDWNIPFVRRVGNKVASFVIWIFFGIRVSDPLSGFRAVTKSAFKKIRWESAGYGVESEMLANIAKRKLRFVEIPIDTIYHDKDKGVSVLDAFGVLLDVLKWRLSP